MRNVLLAILKEYSDEIAVNDRNALAEWLTKNGDMSGNELNSLPDSELTRLAVKTFNDLIPSLQNDTDELSSAFAKLKTVRDKRIAHHESVETDFSAATYAEILKILDTGKEFLAIIGRVYLSSVYRFDDGSHPLTSDAKRATTCLKRLLKKSYIVFEN